MNNSNLTFDQIAETEFSQAFAADVVAAAVFAGVKSDVPQIKGLKGRKDISDIRVFFLNWVRDAMVLSFHKYGPVKKGYGPQNGVRAIESIEPRLKRYEEGGWRGDVEIKPGNTEWLTDVFNFAMIESMCPVEPLKTPEFDVILPPDNRIQAIREVAREFAVDRVYGRLVAIGSLALAEFANPQHPKAHFRGLDNASPGRVDAEGDLCEHNNSILQP